ncbi:MAG: ATP-binding protein [Ignavibacteriae bacterium]|nr:ATP-binding protein [Ignavibacteriota bacterium]NOG99355.1 ATP-binding protein [Ignavibacteriota bacterium]
MPSNEYIKVFPSDPEYLPEIESFILEIAEQNNVDEEKFNCIALSTAEAASNSILHGNKNDPTKKVEIKVVVTDKVMRIIFKDEGKGFEPKSVPDPTTPENILKENGRGIHIMKSYLSSLTYNFTPEGTEAILEIKLDK